MSQLGRISGPLLRPNLIRDGVDLAFETDLLYLNVSGSKIGINNSSPTADLDVIGTTRTTDLQVSNQAVVGTFTISGNTIASSLPTISFNPFGDAATIYQSKLIVDDIQISGNRISTEVTNADLELSANGSGTVEILSTTNITGNLNVSGNVTAVGDVIIGGNVQIGDAFTDTITINASIQSDLNPVTDNTYNLGTSSLRWQNLYVNNIYTDNLNINILQIGDLIFSNNQITSSLGQDIEFFGNGSGGVILGNFKFFDNTITNISANAVSTFQQTGTGYWKIAGTNGFVPPVGTEAERPTAYAVLGMTRYNSETKALEVWDGLDWANPAGASGAVNELTAIEIAATMAIMLG